ncbi:hypothetical protein J14TS2_29710 [Bacillus sp. J14TS2]|uniref:extracellular solute-binding protein n=1 Tax=Bacillus sp. J14TS2 TaxID=2807188 RepID=UPI001B27916A|nr:hypothetical protein J14TS2_29710 [Bacillus sp. J14TS2]
MYANDTIPDVFLAFTGQQPLEQLDSVYPLDDMIESYGVDLSHIQDVALDNVRSRDKERRLVGIPQETTVIGLYYNKEIFDLFGVGYPDPNESMTWDELMDLAPKLTGERSGTYYCGLEMVDLEYAPLSQLSVNKTDPETGEILLSSEPKFTQYIELMNRFYDLPGNDEESCGFEAKTTAMKIGWQGVLVYHDNDYWEIDVAPMPVWKDLPGIGTEPSGHPWAINNFSENKDAALQFIIEGVSEEYQTILSKKGTPVPSSTGVPNQEYGADNPLMEGKNVAALFVNTPAPPPERKSPWDSFVEFDFEKLKESSDIQEFLRRTQEEWEIKIQEAKATQ